MARSCKLPTRADQKMTVSAYGKKLIVRRTRSRSWVIRIEGQKRVRFADLKREACEDIAHFKESGALPRSKGKSWA